jgi:hypothetical protein
MDVLSPPSTAACRWATLGLVMLSGACASPGSSTPADREGQDSGPQAPLDASAGGEASVADTGGGTGEADTSAGEAGGDGAAGGTGCASLPLCDDFDEDTPGAPPANWTVVMGCNPNTQDTPVDGGGLLVGVDTSQHHSGTSSVRVVGGDSCGYYFVNTGAFPHLGTQLYARFWVLFSSGPTQGHNGFLTMPTGGGDHFRLGFQDSVVDWNAETSDSTLPDMDPQGTSLSVGTGMATWTAWNCMEFHLDEGTGDLEFWFNGSAAAVSGLSYDGGVVQGVNDQWSRGAPSPPVPTSFGLGWLGLNDQETVWFDDVALSSSGRIGCD